MQKLIINKPHLQSKLQRSGAFCVAAFSWLLWLYFLLPLLTLAGWLLGLKSLSNEVRWFGGYKTLLELLQMYGGVIVADCVVVDCLELVKESLNKAFDKLRPNGN